MSANQMKEFLTIFTRDIDNSVQKFLDRLRDAIAIPSVSAEPHNRENVCKMVEWTKLQLEKLGVNVDLYCAGKQKLHDGNEIDLPPIIFGVLGADKMKKTLLIYGHLDVQPASKEDGWNTEPFSLVEEDGKLFGRGSTDDKGPVVGWINAIETLQNNNIPIPVNIKFCFEAMEESGSLGLPEALHAKKDTFLADVDFTCISDNYWLGKERPCLTYGLRGCCYYFIEISGVKQDLHSGSHGGVVYEPMADMVWILSQLVDISGKIKIDGLNELVAPVTDDERNLYELIKFDVELYKQDIGAQKLLREQKEDILMSRWRYPSLSIHGIEGAFSGHGAKTVIPAKVIGKFSIRIVPDMNPDEVNKIVIDYLYKLWKQRRSPNNFKSLCAHSGIYWLSNYEDPHYECAASAVFKIHGVQPDFIREGGSIPITLTFQELTGHSVLLLPMGASDDMAHSQNEKLNITNYIQGTKVFGCYILELGKI